MLKVCGLLLVGGASSSLLAQGLTVDFPQPRQDGITALASDCAHFQLRAPVEADHKKRPALAGLFSFRVSSKSMHKQRAAEGAACADALDEVGACRPVGHIDCQAVLTGSQ